MYGYYMRGMITKHDDLVGTLIHDVAYLLRHEIDARLKPHNLTRVKWLALGVIDNHSPLTQSDLAAELELGAASVGRLVDRLVERGFVIRDQDPDDRRSYSLSLSPEASQLVHELDDMADSFREEALKPLSKREIASLTSGLIKIKNSMKAQLLALGATLFVSAHKMSPTAQILTDFGTAL